MINSFTDNYFFLSNFYPCRVVYKGVIYGSSEAAFHAQKDLNRSKEFINLTPREAKAFGRSVHLREDWESVKDRIMEEVVRCKFDQNPHLKEKLLSTGDAELIEGNTWHDTYWGVDNGIGENHLGKILMKIRNDLKDSK